MFETVFAPEDVAAADAALVLGFINEAASAAALRQAIGLSEGEAVGDLVAASLIERRAALGGFTALAQVEASRFVTPLRFTEIVVALSNAAPPRSVPREAGPATGAVGRPPADDRLSLSIEPAAATFWLGQRISVTLRLRDPSGASVLDAPITCWTSWGRLSARQGLRLDRGASVSGRSGTAGLLTMRLEPPLSAPAGHAEQALLEAELSRLDPAAAGTPALAAKELQQSAARYRAEGGGLLRAVVDRLFAELETPPASNPNAPWPTIPVTLLAMAEAPRGGPPTLRAATLRARDWRGAWLAALREALLGGRQVDKALDDALAGDREPSVERLVGTARAFAAQERGAVAAGLRESVASIALNRFLDANAARLGDAVAEVATAVGSATGAISRGGLVVLDTIERARATTPGKADLSDLSDLEGRLRGETRDALESALAGLSAEVGQKLDRSSFDQELGALRRQLEGKADKRTLADLRGELDGVRTESRAVSARVETLDRSVVSLRETIRPARGPGGTR